jgi:hypothetical protein
MVEKANADLIKNIQKNLMVMERDQLAPLGQQVPQDQHFTDHNFDHHLA